MVAGVDFGPVPTSSKSGLTMPDGCASARPVTYIKSLAAPLLVAQTGELCESLQLAPGTIYTIGRSKKTCDIVFLDTRVSRKHCQLYVLPQNNALTLLDGAILDAIPRIQLEAHLDEKHRRFSRRENKKRLPHLESTARNVRLRKIDRRLQGTRIQGFNSDFSMKEYKKRPHLVEKSARIVERRTIDGRRQGRRDPDVNAEGTRKENLSADLLFSSNRGSNRSLNGIFVNGDLIDSRICTVLSSGDEVSLVGPTKAGQCLDINCHFAVGFTVETEPSTKRTNFGKNSAEYCSDASIPSHKRRRRTFSEMVDEYSVDRIESAITISVNLADSADKSNGNKSEPPDLGMHTEKKRAQEDNAVDKERLHCCTDFPVVNSQCFELGKWPEYMRADRRSEERCFGAGVQTEELDAELLLTLDQGKAGKFIARDDGMRSGKASSFPTMVDSFASTVTEKVRTTMEIGPNTFCRSSDRLNLDKQLESTVNLIQESARLRSCVSEILKSSYKGNDSTDQMELQLTKAKEEYPARRDTSSLSDTERVSHASRESSPDSPLSLCGFASSPDITLSDHPMCFPSKELTVPSGNNSNEAAHMFVNKPACASNFGLNHQLKIRKSPAECPATLLSRMPESNQGSLLNSDVIPKEIQVKTQINFASWKEYSICEEKDTQLEGFPRLEGKELDEWRLRLCSATDDSRLSGEQSRTDFTSNLPKLARTSMAAETMIRDVQTDISKGTLTVMTELDAGEVSQDDKYKRTFITQSELSDQKGLRDASNCKLASYKEVEKNTPCNTGMSPVAVESFEVRKERSEFDSLHISAESFPHRIKKSNSEITQKSPVMAPVNLDDICQLIVEDQIGRVQPGVAKVKNEVEEKEHSEWKGDLQKEPTGSVHASSPLHKEPTGSVHASSPTADEKELLKRRSLYVSTSIYPVKDPDNYWIDCNHVNSTTLQDFKPSPVQNILCLQYSSKIKDTSFVKDHSVEPVGLSQKNGDTESNGISCAFPDVETGGLSLCQVECGETSCSSPRCLPCVVFSEKENLFEEAAFLGAPKLQSDPVHIESKGIIGVGVPFLRLNCEDDNLNVGMCEGRDIELQHTENISKKHVNLEVMKSLDSCSMNDSHILPKTISEKALSSKELDDDLIQPDLHQMTSIAITNSACTVVHISQEQSYNEKVEQSEMLQMGEARVDLGISLDLMVKDQVNKGVKTTDLREMQSMVDRSYSSGYFLNQLKDVVNEGSGTHTSISIQELLAPVDDLEAVLIATFTYDLPWFLSFAGFSRDLPVTVACHNADRCWSQSREDRCDKPYLDWPNVTLVYPPFPNACAFGKRSKKRGIGCHHPKLFLLRRTSSIRVIISSANLTPRQWFEVTNNVWWQDFPVRGTSDFKSLFQGEEHSDSTKNADFASQLATFIAALLTDCPSESHWVTDLADIDFSSAAGSLVTSIPGLHHPLYHNAPEFLISLEMGSSSYCQLGDSWSPKHLGVVTTAVVGITYRFRASADPKGVRIRALAAILNEACAYAGLTMPVLLKRAKYVTADPNAVSVVVTSKAKGCSQDLFLQEDLHNADIHTLESIAFQSEEDFVKLGFLPRDVASWLAVLCDGGFFSFAACIWPKEALAVASGQADGVVKLALYVFQGPKFSELSTSLLSTKEVTALCGLLKSLHRPWGLWRLEQVLSKHNWQDSEESDFFFASSSIGTSLDAKFLAAFAAASGRRAVPSAWSQDSDPDWGCWTARLEADNPSIGIVFPSIERVQKDNFAQYGLLCFAESAWQRLKSANLLYDAIPCSPEREGFPMHVKVARRQFQKSPSSPPYGWIYCGSHNFSPAAWGRPQWRPKDGEAATDAGIVLGSTLHIANYEIGIVLVEPPPPVNQQSSQCKHEISELENETARRGLDRFTMPFKMPPPKYKQSDRPATGKAMYEAFMNMKAMELIRGEEDFAVLQSEVPLEGELNQEDANLLVQEEVNSKGEAEYVEALWSQIENQGS